ncbi:hypothetical protein [Kangiella sediminilitoris]|uniref:Signal peptide protein n=1 Tax=Kangiella sediminilitoris TaxID=1144748 RepID=A0A1B3BBE3_9GAMM|nr:hypothetical protein [Kangiella sediminilitoris]AOE50113.1 signal peptide protein [Kangiella sediminilitoris]
MGLKQKSLTTALTLLLANTVCAEGTDIMLLPLSEKDGHFEIELEPVHITQRDGYDNQPKFTLDSDSIFFTRMQGVEGKEQQQTDIYRYSLQDNAAINITQTDEHSEYSATPYDSDSVSIIGVNPQGQQHLRKVNLLNAEQEVWRKDIEPIGYHAWLNENQAAVFVLGDVMTLQILDIRGSERPSILAENIGRCLQTVRHGKVSFTVEEAGQHHLKTLSSKGHIEDTGITLPKGVQDYIWLDEVSVLAGENSRLLKVERDKASVIADLEELNVRGITRLAISPDKSKLAIVYERP